MFGPQKQNNNLSVQQFHFKANNQDISDESFFSDEEEVLLTNRQIPKTEPYDDETKVFTQQEIEDSLLIEEESQGNVLKPQQSIDYNKISTKQEAKQYFLNFTIRISSKEEQRTPDAHKEGGKKCFDQILLSTLRSVAKEMIKLAGKKLISGQFNLTQISFPIRANIPKTTLECVLYATCYFPLYINKATLTEDPLERLKLLIAASISSFPIANTFYKPLNPYLGETLEGMYVDGTKLFCEQISHHPPISYLYVVGPNKKYVSYGYSDFEASAGLNSLKLKNNGKRYIKFINENGTYQTIQYNQGYEYFSGTFLGTTKHESLGKILFQDFGNNIKAEIEIGNVKKKPSDYLEGKIYAQGKCVSKIYGSYLGFLDIDDKRYWDFRQQLPFKNRILKSSLQSDHSKRLDKILLNKGDLKKAQEVKEGYEYQQRYDNRLRQDYKNKIQKLKKKK